MSDPAILGPVERYYTEKLRAHGPTHRGADWSSAESQALRFDQLLKICERTAGVPVSINDYGCGYGALAEHLQAHGGGEDDYCGFDVSTAMIEEAGRLHQGRPRCRFVSESRLLPVADYTVASGIFNVKLETTDDAWRGHVLATLDILDQKSRRGFAFNMLTAYSDPERMRVRPDLYYADPHFFFDHCRTRYSRRVALLHDYPLYELTLLVRK